MIIVQKNPSGICPNPSHVGDRFACISWVKPTQSREYVHNLSPAVVTDFERRKSINNKNIYSLSLNMSRCPAPARAMCVRTREGVCDIFPGTDLNFESSNPSAPLSSSTPHFALRWPTFARSATNASLFAIQTNATRAKPCDVGAGARVAGQRIGTSRQDGRNSGFGRGHAINHSLFCLSDFFYTVF
jgi:hypothetical protein